MTANPKLSVCVPMYNKVAAVERCLGTILAHNIDGMEILIFDNGSTDGSSGIARDLAARDTRVRYVRLDHTIMVQESWRMAMLHSKGDLLKVHSADDELHPDFWRHMLPPLENPEIDFAMCMEQVEFNNVDNLNKAEFQRFWATINESCRQILNIREPLERARQIVLKATILNNLGNLYKIVFRRRCLPLERWKAIINAYPMPTSYPDWDYLIRLVLNYRGQFVDKILCTYSISPDAPLVRLQSTPALVVADAHQLTLMLWTVLADPTLQNLRSMITPQELQSLFQEAVKRLENSVNYTLAMAQPRLRIDIART